MASCKALKRIALGTVQFGLAYGITNRRGMVPAAEVSDILDLAAESGIDTLDTAAAYGASEEVIGSHIRAKGGAFKIVTKIKGGGPDMVHGAVTASLRRTGVSRFHGVLLHSFEEYAAQPELYGALSELKKAGLTQKTGFSLYLPQEAERLLDDGVQFDIVQVPYSIIDRRFEPLFEKIKRAGAEIHVRSVFLQGLLLTDTQALPAGLAALKPKIDALKAYALDNGLSVAALCVLFALDDPRVDKAVIGVDGMDSLRDNIARLEMAVRGWRPEGMRKNLAWISETDERLILPQNWRV